MQTVSVDALEGAYQGMADTRSSRGVTYPYNFMQTLLRRKRPHRSVPAAQVPYP